MRISEEDSTSEEDSQPDGGPGGGPRRAGVLAQEVKAVLPEVVDEDADGMMHVAYGNVTALLIEAIKELKQQVAALSAQVAALAPGP